MIGEVSVWVLVGLAVGLAGRILASGSSRAGFVATLAVAVFGSLVGGFAADAVLGDLGRVRVSVAFSGAIGSVRFGFLPFVIAVIAATVAIALLTRGLPQRDT